QDGSEYRALFTPQGTAPTSAANTITWNGHVVVASNAAFLSVDGVTAQPSNQTFAPTVTFTAASFHPGDTVAWQGSTDGGKSYQPLSDGGPYSGTATPALTLTGATGDMLSNEYQAVFSGGGLTFSTVAVALVPAGVWDDDPAANRVQQGAGTGTPVG